MEDGFRLRKRAALAPKGTDLAVAIEGNAQSQFGACDSLELVSGTSSIANQKTKVIKTEILSPRAEDDSEKMRKMRILLSRAQQLTEEEKIHAERAHGLEEQIQKSELEYGQMLQNLLKLQRALELKKKHIEEDREMRVQELSFKQSKSEGVRLALAEMNAIAMDKTG